MTKTLSGTREQRFLSGLTHELRTPLGSILMLAELLEENRSGSMSDKDLAYVEKILQAASDVRALIDDVSLLSRIDAGRVTVTLADVSLRWLLDKLAPDEAEAAKPSRDLVSCEGDLPEGLITDGELLLRILRTLLSEARRVSADKPVTLTVDIAETGRLRFRVRDNGPSVPQDRLQELFEPFAVAGSRNRRQFGGQSLSLPIARRLSQLLGGELSLRSGQGEGNTLELVLPIDPG